MHPTITSDDAKRAREALGASQTAVAAAVGVNRTYYSLFEAGRYVLDEQEQQQLREFLADALPAPSTETDPDDDGDPQPADGGRQRARRHARPAGASAATPKPGERIAEAVAALTALRNAAAEPNGLRSKRTAVAVGDATAALEPLDYAELLDLAKEHAVPTAGLPDLKKFNALDLDGMKLWESRAIGLLVCDTLYDGQWSAMNFDALKDAESELHRALGDGVVEYKAVWLWPWEDEKPHAPLRRAELAPFVVRAAQKRGAPMVAQSPAPAASHAR